MLEPISQMKHRNEKKIKTFISYISHSVPVDGDSAFRKPIINQPPRHFELSLPQHRHTRRYFVSLESVSDADSGLVQSSGWL